MGCKRKENRHIGYTPFCWVSFCRWMSPRRRRSSSSINQCYSSDCKPRTHRFFLYTFRKDPYVWRVRSMDPVCPIQHLVHSRDILDIHLAYTKIFTSSTKCNLLESYGRSSKLLLRREVLLLGGGSAYLP